MLEFRQIVEQLLPFFKKLFALLFSNVWVTEQDNHQKKLQSKKKAVVRSKKKGANINIWYP